MQKKKLIVEETEENHRLDIYLAKQYGELSRSYIQKIIKEENVTVNGKLAKPRYLIKAGDIIDIEFPIIQEIAIEAEDIKLNIVYEDKDILVVDKPQGMVVHPAVGNYTGTLVNALLDHCGPKNLSTINGTMRPGIVHRIDKDTSGLLVVAKNDKSHEDLAKQFKEHTTLRKYNAVVSGSIKEDRASIDAPIGRNPIDRLKRAVIEDGKPSVTHFKVLERFIEYTFIEATLETGRTHQIRVHLAYIENPIIGDLMYGYKNTKFNLKGQVLHSRTLGLIHPTSGQYMEFTSELPEDFNKVLNVVRMNHSIY